MSNGTPSNGLFGWWGQLAQMSAVGIIGVLSFLMFFKMTAQMKDFTNDTNDFHSNIYQHIGREAESNRQRDIKIEDINRKIDLMNQKLDRIEWRLAFQSGGILSLFPDPKKQ